MPQFIATIEGLTEIVPAGGIGSFDAGQQLVLTAAPDATVKAIHKDMRTTEARVAQRLRAARTFQDQARGAPPGMARRNFQSKAALAMKMADVARRRNQARKALLQATKAGDRMGVARATGQIKTSLKEDARLSKGVSSGPAAVARVPRPTANVGARIRNFFRQLFQR